MSLEISQLRAKFSQTYYERGEELFNNKKVVSLRVEDDEPQKVYLYGEVLGSINNVYEQGVHLSFSKNRLIAVFGSCSCPVNHNCKHVIAICLEYYKSMSVDVPKEDRVFNDWFRRSQAVVDTNLSNRDDKDFYSIRLFNQYSTDADYSTPSFCENEVDIFKHGFTLKGKPSKPRKNKLRTLQNKVNQFDSRQTVYMVKLLESCLDDDWYDEDITFQNEMGFMVLSELIKLGVAHFKMQETSLVWSDELYELPLVFDDKQQQFNLDVPIEKNHFLVLCEPPIILNTQNNSAQMVKTSLSGATIELLLDMPPVVNLEQLDSVVDLFEKDYKNKNTRHAELTLPLPKITAFDVSVIKETPIATLRFKDSDRFIFEVSFNYGDLNVKPSFKDEGDVLNIKKHGKRYELHIQKEAERKLLLQLANYLVPLDPNHQLTHQGFFGFSDDVIASSDKMQKFLELQDNVFPILKSSGWLLTFSEDELLDIEQIDEVSVESKPDNDWFELSFNMTIGKQQYSMLPIMQYLLANYAGQDELPEKIYAPVNNAKVLAFSKKQILPIFETFMQLYGSKEDVPGKIEIQAFDAHLIHGLGNGEITWKGSKEALNLAEKLKNFKGIEKVTPPKGLNANLRDYQQFGLNWLNFLHQFNFNGILADDMGLGKTIQTLTWILKLKETNQLNEPVLLIVPTSLIGNWKAELKRFTPDLTLLTLHGSERVSLFSEINNYDIIITTYPLIVRDVEVLQKHHFAYLVLDEAQKIKNPKTKLYQVLQTLKSKHRLCLTGTPIENHLGELWSIFNFLMPGFLSNYPRFKKYFQNPIEKEGKSSIQGNLTAKVTPFLLRRTKKEVVTELPDKTEIIKVAEFEPDQANLYETIRLTMEAKIRDVVAENGIGKSQIMILDALLKLRQVCCDPRLVKIDAAKKVKNSAKLEMLMDLLVELLEGEHKVILFSQFTSMLTLIEERLKRSKINYSLLTGQTKKREETIEKFKQGETSVFLISLKAGGVGLNLTEADTVIHYDPWWNPAVENQATDRAYRIGQNKDVFVYKFIVANTIEEKIIDLQVKKQALQDQVFNQKGQKEQAKITGEDLMGLLSSSPEA